MAEHVLIRLKAPMAAFGGPAGERKRPTGDMPSLSMLVGLLGNALGCDRNDGEDMGLLDRLQAEARYACARLGEVLTYTDLQIARAPTAGDAVTRMRHGGRYTDDPDLLIAPKGAGKALDRTLDKPALSEKTYLTDAHYLVAFEPGDVMAASTLDAALRAPARPLWIGRKACPPSAPLAAGIIDAEDVLDALQIGLSRDPERQTLVKQAKRNDEIEIEWVGQSEISPPVRRITQTQRRDRRHWQVDRHGNTGQVHLGRLAIRFAGDGAEQAETDRG